MNRGMPEDLTFPLSDVLWREGGYGLRTCGMPEELTFLLSEHGGNVTAEAGRGR